MSRTRLKLISGEPNPEGDWHVILSTSWWRGKVHFEPLQCHCRGQNFLMTLHYLMKYRKLYTSLFRSSRYTEVTSINLLWTKQMLGNDTWTQKELYYQSKCLSLLTVPKWVYLSFLSPETEPLQLKSSSTDSTAFQKTILSAYYSESWLLQLFPWN